MQARVLTCGDKGQIGGGAHHAYAPRSGLGPLVTDRTRTEPDAEASLRSLSRLDAVGLTEYTSLSVCLMMSRVLGGASPLIPPGCYCDSKGLAKPDVHIRHRVPVNHSIEAARDAWPLIDTMVKVDEVVYEAARKRFFRDLREMEAATGRRMLCD